VDPSPGRSRSRPPGRARNRGPPSASPRTAEPEKRDSSHMSHLPRLIPTQPMRSSIQADRSVWRRLAHDDLAAYPLYTTSECTCGVSAPSAESAQERKPRQGALISFRLRRSQVGRPQDAAAVRSARPSRLTMASASKQSQWSPPRHRQQDLPENPRSPRSHSLDSGGGAAVS
jgi:hypothetical protein